MNHQEIRRELRDRIDNLLATYELLPIEQRLYQKETLISMRSWLDDPNGTPRGYVAHATGLGKTILFALLLRSCAGLRSIVIVPTKVLIVQTARAVARLTGGVVGHLSGLKSVRDDDGELVAVRGHEFQDIVITTDASFRRHLPMLMKHFVPQVILRDECHWAYVQSSMNALAAFPEAVIIGFSATPDYLGLCAKPGYTPVTLDNGRVLYGPRDKFAETHFGTKIDARGLRWGIENGWLAPLAWGLIEFEKDIAEVPLADGPVGLDYDEKALQSAMGSHWSMLEDTICRLYANGEYDLPTRQTYAICPSVKQARSLAKRLNEQGIASACISGETSDVERETILAMYRDGEVRFLSSVMVLREGWDAPNAEVCMMLRPTKSRVFYEQCIGRSLRLAAGGAYKVALVLDVYFQNERLAPLSAPVLYGEPGKEVTAGDILIGPRVSGRIPGDGATDSPYLPKGMKPRIVVVPAIEPEYRMGEDGTIEVDGEVWKDRQALSAALGLHINTIERRLDTCRSMIVMNSYGRSIKYYALTDVQRSLADLLSLPRVDADGRAVVDGRELMTLPRAAKLVGLTAATVRKRMPSSSISRGRDSGGHSCDLVSLSEVQSIFANMLEKPKADRKTGGFIKDGEVWKTAEAHGRDINISGQVIARRLSECPTIEGRDPIGKPAIFYAQSDVHRVFAELLDKPVADATGSIEAHGHIWKTESGCTKELGITPFIFRQWMRGGETLVGRDRQGQVRVFYPISILRSVCADLLEDLGSDGRAVKKRSSVSRKRR